MESFLVGGRIVIRCGSTHVSKDVGMIAMVFAQWRVFVVQKFGWIEGGVFESKIVMRRGATHVSADVGVFAIVLHSEAFVVFEKY